MTTEHFVVKAIDVIGGDTLSRTQILVQTQEGTTVVLYLPERLEAGLREDAAKHLNRRDVV